MSDIEKLADQFGSIDIYLFDQLLRGRVNSGVRVLDAGCGGGRNLRYLMRAGSEVFAVDRNPRAIASVREAAHGLAPCLPAENFRVEPVEETSFPDAFFGFVISNAVLHFVDDEEQFHAILAGMWRVLEPGGILFCRLASTIGCEGEVKALDGRRYIQPDGDERFLVDEPFLMETTRALGAELADSLKTSVVAHLRSMTTWVLRKPRSGPETGS